MPKLIAFLIISAYTIYFLLTPPLTIHDESAHVEILVGVAQGEYLYTGFYEDSEYKKLGANKKLEESLRYEDHPYQIPTFNALGSIKEAENDYALQGIYSHEAYSPPLYYIVGTIFYYISKLSPYLLEQFYIMRLASAFFYFGTVIISWKILTIFFKNKKVASSVLLFFSLNPLVLKMGIGVNPDMGGTFFSLCVFYFLLKHAATKLTIKKVVKVSLLSAFATLTKISGLFTNAFVVLYVLFTQKLKKNNLQKLLLFEGVFLLLTLPWFLFIFNRYETFFPEPFSAMCVPLEQAPLIVNFFEIFGEFRYTIMNFAGFMGENWPYPFNWFFITYVLLFFVFFLVGVRFVLQQKEKIYKMVLLYILPLIILLTLMSAQFRIKQIECDIQGRYLMPVFLALCLVVYWGIFSFTKNEEKAAKIVGGFAIFHYLFILFTVLVIRYYV